MLEQAWHFASDILAPLNASVDRQGFRYQEGRVLTPDGFAETYQAFVEGCRPDWAGLACSAEYSGQDMPLLLNAAVLEILAAANHAWFMYRGIAHGAYECLNAHAPQWLRAYYLPRIVSGVAGQHGAD